MKIHSEIYSAQHTNRFRSPTLSGSFQLVLLIAFFLLKFEPVLSQNNRSGETLFEANCATCHNFKQDGIGPQLGGLKEVVDQKYLTDFIKNPKVMIDNRVARAYDKFKKFRTVMPGFNHLKPGEIDDIVAYILEKPAPTNSSLAKKTR